MSIPLEQGTWDLYVAFGYSNRSEKDAFEKARDMLDDVKIDSIAPDRYHRKRSQALWIHVCVIPKKNCNSGAEWERLLKS